jgi:hypothetical protein
MTVDVGRTCGVTMGAQEARKKSTIRRFASLFIRFFPRRMERIISFVFFAD